jgi:hypothetical protein
MQRRTIPTAFAAMLTLAFAGPATAQADDRGTLDGMRACAKIDDTDQRTACYDRFLRPNAKPAVPSADASVAGTDHSGRVRPSPAEAKPSRARSTEVVAAAVERAPGIYRLTMTDGGQWEFAATMRATYDPPARGATVEIQPGALGSYLLSYNDQSVVRVVRVR